jgi:hypothetical protein
VGRRQRLAFQQIGHECPDVLAADRGSPLGHPVGGEEVVKLAGGR